MLNLTYSCSLIHYIPSGFCVAINLILIFVTWLFLFLFVFVLTDITVSATCPVIKAQNKANFTFCSDYNRVCISGVSGFLSLIYLLQFQKKKASKFWKSGYQLYSYYKVVIQLIRKKKHISIET